MNRRLFSKSLLATPFLTSLTSIANEAVASTAKAKRVIYLTFSGGPSQLDLYDYKPDLVKYFGQELPPSVRGNQRITTMTSVQSSLGIKPTQYNFHQNKNSGMFLSELLPHFSEVSNEICLINSMTSPEINHDPAICYLLTGSPRAGKASLGSWISYSLGALNKNLPDFVVLTSVGGPTNQSVNQRLWNSGYLPSKHQGTKFYNGANPVLFLKNPENISAEERLEQLSHIKALNDIHYQSIKDPEILARTAQYELAGRMQSAIPEAVDMSNETASTFDMYGPEAKTPGTFASNCLLARKLIERDVRFVQLFHRGWDSHEFLSQRLPTVVKSADQPMTALIKDLKQRGLLDDTLIVCAGEFGRTVFSQGYPQDLNYGRDHHGRCFSIWLAGAGVKKGISYGKSDDFSFNVQENPVTPNELNATILHLLGKNHLNMTYFNQGLEEKLTGVEPVSIIKGILS